MSAPVLNSQYKFYSKTFEGEVKLIAALTANPGR